MSKTDNKSKTPPKNSIRFSISLSEEQKTAKSHIIKHPFSFVVGNAGSGKTLLAVQVALDMFFKRQYNKPDKLEIMTRNEDIELVSLAHFRGRTFDQSVVIVDEFQNLTRSQFMMALSRLGKNSIMIFCGDRQQIDLKDKNYSAIHEVSKIISSKHVYKVILEENHRHEALFDVLELLNKH